jgi:NB-ARC domain
MQNQHDQRPDVVSQLNGSGNGFAVRKALNIFAAVFGLVCLTVLFFSLWDISHKNPKEVGLDPAMTILIGIVIPVFGIVCSVVANYIQVHVAITPASSVNQFSTAIQPDASSDNLITPVSPSIHGISLYINQKVVLQHKRMVRDIVKKLQHSDATVLVLTGLTGIGKSTLAALIYQHYRTSKHPLVFLRKSFVAQPLRLTITDKVTFTHIAEALFKYLNSPIPPNFYSLDPEDKAFVLINAMENAKRTCLAILDQFDNWLELRTGYALPKYPEVDAWLKALNSQKCRCKLLLTSRVLPRARPGGSFIEGQADLEKYVVKGLGSADGMKLLRMRNISATEAELRFTVKQSGGHAGALAELAALLQQKPTLSLNTPRCISLWRRILADKFLVMRYLKQLHQQEYDLLISFSVYRTAVSLETVLQTSSDLIAEETWNALDILLQLHLFQRVGSSYRLHPVIAIAIQEYLERVDKQTLQVIHENAANYYQDIGWPASHEERPREALTPLVETIWHLGLAERWKDAYNLMEREGVANELRRWGESLSLLELCLPLLPVRKWNPPLEQEQRIDEDLCKIYEMLDRKTEAERYQQEASRIEQKIRRRSRESIS